jgi:hypothetical protein
MRPSDFTRRTEAAEQSGERDDNVTSTNKNFGQGLTSARSAIALARKRIAPTQSTSSDPEYTAVGGSLCSDPN